MGVESRVPKRTIHPWWIAGLVVLCGCGSDSPSGPGLTTPLTLGVPTPLTPIGDAQLTTLRPTLTVQNATSDQPEGVRTYDFEISDRSDFITTASAIPGFFAVVSQSGVPEGPNGQTSFTPAVDLQPATRMFWRARVTQSGVVSAWSATAMFRTKTSAFIRSGELYDPLVSENSVGTVVGSTTYIPGAGLQLNTEQSYVRYELPTTIPNGEFSVDVQGLRRDGPDHKLKIFSMSDTTGDLFNSQYQVSTMYRGIDGNPPNCIAFKAVFGGGTPIEPDFAARLAATHFLNPATTYHWKSTWGSDFRLSVREGGIQGNEIYNLGFSSGGRTYTPPRHYAYLGSTNGVSNNEPGTFPGAIYRNVWIGNRPRPSTLGTALIPLR